ncbi:hypothetical protein NECAME_10788 [Necator americanus]|uniref:Uncharacterized protein n=1 Tax=Necator americanus TaxID=51031 RepID=W2T7I3_NECAM|nr:hypothetical protein NECAME_10788 [Necator americanus]ETN77808.1 hypothetical protein NECAME_10788 [Necator americanus]
MDGKSAALEGFLEEGRWFLKRTTALRTHRQQVLAPNLTSTSLFTLGRNQLKGKFLLPSEENGLHLGNRLEKAPEKSFPATTVSVVRQRLLLLQHLRYLQPTEMSPPQ